MNDSETSVAEREASAMRSLASRVLANQVEIAKVTEIAQSALHVARRGPETLPLWIIAALIAVLVGEGAALLTR